MVCDMAKVTIDYNRKSDTSFQLVPLLMTVKDIWRSFQSRLSFPRPVSQKLYEIRPQLLKLVLRNHTSALLELLRITATMAVILWYTGTNRYCHTCDKNKQPRLERLFSGQSVFIECRCWRTAGASGPCTVMYVMLSKCSNEVHFTIMSVLNYSNACHNEQ